jgi:hypothetical protein
MVEEVSEKQQNVKLKSLMLIEKLGNQGKIEIGSRGGDFKKIILSDFCITPKCKRCPSDARKCEHKDNR